LHLLLESKLRIWNAKEKVLRNFWADDRYIGRLTPSVFDLNWPG
jgi:hypothetical protein